MRPDRRKFLHDTICAALGGAGLYSALGGLQLVQAATRASNYTFPNYKALVCVFLYGGNDSFNAVVPISGAARTGYASVRPTLALPANTLHALTPPASGFGSSGDGCSYGLHASMPELATLFNAGKAAVVANVGTLVGPVTKDQFQNGHPALPPTGNRRPQRTRRSPVGAVASPISSPARIRRTSRSSPRSAARTRSCAVRA
jgi:uncharacterized protein (DUF1501 family)